MARSKPVYDFKTIEKKWNKYWLDNKLYKAVDFDKRPKYYVLVEFPYPSAAGLHMGHCRNYTAFDAYARYFRMKGYNVLYPMGWDAFGLPLYNYAIKVGKDPHDASEENIRNFKKQLIKLGGSFDWDREINTTDPEYYKWTQWIFVQFYNHWYDPEYPRKDGGKGKARHIDELPIPEEVKKKGPKAIKEYQDKFRLAYKAKMPVFYCPSCKMGVANEEVEADGTHERCHNPVEVRELEQWMLRITAYADRLIEDLDLVDYSESIKQAQINWIGRKYGALVNFKIDGTDDELEVYTTRPDTIFGVTFVVVAPDSEFVSKYQDRFAEPEKVKAYVKEALVKQATEAMDRSKSGVFTGMYAIHPITKEKVPIYIADFVVSDYGTGAVMGVPAHDQRDYEFAKEHNLPIKWVVKPKDGEWNEDKAYESKDSVVINSDFLNGLGVKEAIQKAIEYFTEHKIGKMHKAYHLRDWVFSRQHYWGEPTPMVYCEKCGWNPVPVDELPVKLPRLSDYRMAEDGTSPLQRATEWKKTTCPVCGGPAERETDVMPNWAGSNWYYLRYLDPHNKEKLVDYNKAEYWMPVDLYDGGAEHNTMHLLYSRFVYKFLYDIGVVPVPEPYQRRITHGLVLGPDGKKMSKSRGNVITPDEVVDQFGADVVRTYVMFMGPHDATLPWSDEAMMGVKRFLDRIWIYASSAIDSGFNTTGVEKENEDMKIDLNELAKKVGDDISKVKFNTAIAKIMEFFNKYEKIPPTRDNLETLLKILAPFAPFITEELWHRIGNKDSIHLTKWPEYDPSLAKQKEVEVVVQVNGKVRGKVSVRPGADQEEVLKKALGDEKIKRYVKDRYKKVVYVQDKVLNIVT